MALNRAGRAAAAPGQLHCKTCGRMTLKSEIFFTGRLVACQKIKQADSLLTAFRFRLS